MSDASALQDLLIDEWVEGKTWDGFVRYATKNLDGFKGLYEKVKIPHDIEEAATNFRGRVRVIVIGADWCGDVVANLPAMAKLAALNPNIDLRIVDRDRHPELMDHFLTNGGKAIPKVIVCNSNMTNHETWGPRPAECQQIMTEGKASETPMEEIRPKIRDWYMNDKSQSVLRDIWGMILDVSNKG